jgi:hypothetical protein
LTTINLAKAEIYDDKVWINVYHDVESRVLIRDLTSYSFDNSLNYDKVVIFKDKVVYSQVTLSCKDNLVKEDFKWTLNLKDLTHQDEDDDSYFLSESPSASYVKQTYCGLSTNNSSKKFLFSFPIMK